MGWRIPMDALIMMVMEYPTNQINAPRVQVNLAGLVARILMGTEYLIMKISVKMIAGLYWLMVVRIKIVTGFRIPKINVLMHPVHPLIKVVHPLVTVMGMEYLMSVIYALQILVLKTCRGARMVMAMVFRTKRTSAREKKVHILIVAALKYKVILFLTHLLGK
jgi:hypothetical protein